MNEETKLPETPEGAPVRAAYRVATKRGLNMRESPDGKVIVVLPYERAVYAAPHTGKPPEWLFVTVTEAGVCDELSGWVKSEFLAPAGDEGHA